MITSHWFPRTTLISLFTLLLVLTGQAQNHLPCLQQSEYRSDWKYVGPFNEYDKTENQHFGAISAISVNPKDPMEIFVGANSAGLFHTSNRGLSWECLTDEHLYPVIGVNDIWIDYSKKPYTILISTGTKTVCDIVQFAILLSKDGGRTWTNHFKEDSTLFVSCSINKIRKDSTRNIFYAFGNHNIIRSRDQGESWEEIFSLTQVPSVISRKDFEITSLEINNAGDALYFTTHASYDVNPSGDSVLLQCDLIKIENCNSKKENIQYKKSTSILTETYSPKTNKKTFALKITRKNQTDDILYIDRTYLENYEHSIYVFDMQQQKCLSYWSPNNNYLPEDIFWRAGLQVNPNNPKYMYLAGNVLYKSTDSGKTFVALYPYSFGENNTPHADIRCYSITKYSPDGESDYIYLGTDGGLSFSNNGGKSFVNLNGESLPITQFYGMGVSPFTGSISAGSQDNSIMSYLPKEKKWIVAIRGDGYDVEYDKLRPNIAYGQYNSRAMMMTKNDVAPFNMGLFIEPKERASNKKTLACDKKGTLYFAEEQFNILTKNEKTWVRTSFEESHETLAFAVCESDNNIIYLSKFWHSLFKSIDGGKTFSNISDKLTINGGLRSNTRIHAICVSPTNADKVWISLGYLGNYKDPCKQTERVLFSEDGGEHWTDYSEGLPVYNISDLVYLDGSQDALFAASIEGVFFRENGRTPWKLFSKNLPKCVIPEMQISYCRGKLIAGTYGRGIWETDLPSISYTEPLKITKNTIWEVEADEALYFTTDVWLHKKATLYINSPVHMAKNKTLWVKNLNQIKLGKNGKLLNDCGENWNGIQIKK